MINRKDYEHFMKPAVMLLDTEFGRDPLQFWLTLKTIRRGKDYGGQAQEKPSCQITKKQLEYLAGRVKKLQRLTKKICTEKIESFK